MTNPNVTYVFMASRVHGGTRVITWHTTKATAISACLLGYQRGDTCVVQRWKLSGQPKVAFISLLNGGKPMQIEEIYRLQEG